MSDTHPSYFGSEAFHRFKKMNDDIFKVEVQAKALGFEDVRLALYRSRIEIGRCENRYRREFTRIAEEVEQRDE